MNCARVYEFVVGKQASTLYQQGQKGASFYGGQQCTRVNAVSSQIPSANNHLIRGIKKENCR